MSTLFEKHADTLNEAVEAARTRTCWSAYPEIPSGKRYGDTVSHRAVTTAH